MTDTTAQAGEPEPQAGQGQTTVTEPGQTKEPETTQEWTPKAAAARIKELNAENAKWHQRFRDAEKAKAAAEAEALAEQGRYKELYEKVAPKLSDYDAIKERYDALIAQVQAANEKRIAAIPEQMRSLVPEYDDPQRLAAWLEANAAVFSKPAAPSLDGRAGGNGTASAAVTDEEIEQLAARWRVKPEHIDRAAAAKMLRGK